MAKGHKKIAGSYCYKGNGCTCRFCEFCSNGDKYEEIEDKEIKDESYLENQYSTNETIKERIDNLIADYQERIKAEKHFMDMNIGDMKRIVVAVGVSSIEGMCGNIARQIDKQEIKINMMECFVNELMWADLGEDNAKGNC